MTTKHIEVALDKDGNVIIDIVRTTGAETAWVSVNTERIELTPSLAAELLGKLGEVVE